MQRRLALAAGAMAYLSKELVVTDEANGVELFYLRPGNSASSTASASAVSGVRPSLTTRYTGAVSDALRPLGIHHLDFPYTPDRVWHAIHG